MIGGASDGSSLFGFDGRSISPGSVVSHQDPLGAAALQLADGDPIDWPAHEAAIPESERRYLARLRQLEAVALVHASAGQTQRPAVHDSIRSGGVSTGETPVRWGPLEVLEKIGHGSYGDVYRARDPRLGRDVALKLLRHREHPTVEENALVREGHLLSRVRHPAVVTVYGAERIDGRTGLWMEFVDGETLDDEVRRHGPRPPADVIDAGVTLCSALAAIHAAGLLHRDIKAQNVMRDAHGRLVLMDFGTGRETLDASADDFAGTPVYVAPEILAGGAATVQSDIYSLGVLLWFLATGTFPVVGRSVADIRDAHARRSRDAPLPTARRGMTKALAGIIQRAVAPDPSARYQAAGELEEALARVHPSARRLRRRRWIMGAIATALTAAATAVLMLSSRRTATRDLALTQLTFNSVELPVTAAAISPDGRYLAYGDTGGLTVRSISTGQPQRIALPASVGVGDVAWLPDGTTLIVANAAGIWRTSILANAPVRIAATGGGLAVAPTVPRIAVTNPARTEIRVITANGEPVSEVVRVAPSTTLSRAAWSPDGQRIAYATLSQTPAGIRRTLETRRADGADATVVFADRDIHDFIWAADGRILFSRPNPPPRARYGNLWEVRVDPVSGRAVSPPAQLTHIPDFTFRRPSLTADGRRLAFMLQRLRLDVYAGEFDPTALELRDVRGAVLTNADSWPASWTPDGTALLFLSMRDQRLSIYRQRHGGVEPENFLPDVDRSLVQAVVSPDQHWIYYLAAGRGHVMRRAVTGGAAEELAQLPVTAPQPWLRCARHPAAVCAVSELGGGIMRMTVFEPSRAAVLHRLDLPPPPSAESWDLSPDGTRLASLTTGPAPRMIVADVSTGNVLRDFAVPASAQSVAWSGDGMGWLVTRAAGDRGGEVLYVRRDGGTKSLWTSTYQRLWRPIVSPDGRRVAFSSQMVDSTVWMLKPS